MRIPDTQSVDDMVAVTHDRQIVGNSHDRSVVFLNEMSASCLRIIFLADRTAESDLCLVFIPADLKRITILDPFIRHFLLIAVLNLLLEHSVVITNAASVCRIAKSRQGVEETSCQTSQTAVSERGIRLLIFYRVQIDTDGAQRFTRIVIRAHVHKVVTQQTADQKLHRHIVDRLRVLLIDLLLGRDPVIDDIIFDCIADSLEELLL